ncbi:conserved domain protein [Trichinella spiralis]|uniref:hypothetical protein n=1 Tax=Trichinella spiralis TaxID=6334 RepID=UPI0001EFCC30|nr:conserved domain protein [Trichinella spiralis]
MRTPHVQGNQFNDYDLYRRPKNCGKKVMHKPSQTVAPVFTAASQLGLKKDFKPVTLSRTVAKLTRPWLKMLYDVIGGCVTRLITHLIDDITTLPATFINYSKYIASCCGLCGTCFQRMTQFHHRMT